MRQVIGALADVYEPAELAGGQPYDVRNISVPVFGPGREPVLALTLYGLPPSISPAQIDAYAAALGEASAAISRDLA